jgi:GMP synthase (glutamine-hydrolysing)
MLLIIDNTKNLEKAFMTPKLLNLLNVEYKIASTREQVNEIIQNYRYELKGVILSGGPLCLSEELTIASINKNITVFLELNDLPILGICFGFQIMSASYGGKIQSMKNEENGLHTVYLKPNIFSKLTDGLPESFEVFQSHKDIVVEIPDTFSILGVDEENKIQIIESKKRNLWGVQFHPEALETTKIIIQNFVDICYK